jgi:hypothetical protein
MLTMIEATGWWVPDVILTKQDLFDFLHYFLPLIFGYSTLTFHLCRAVSIEGGCRPMGPKCHSHKTRFVWFLALFFTPNFWLLNFNMGSLPLVNAAGCCSRKGPGCQPHYARIIWFLQLFFTSDFWLLEFNFPSCRHVNAARRCWLMGPRCQPHNTRFSWYLDYFLPMMLLSTCLVYLPLFSIPSLNHHSCWPMGPQGQLLGIQQVCEVFVIVVPHFWPVILRAISPFLHPFVILYNLLRLREGLRCGSLRWASVYKKCVISCLFLPVILPFFYPFP